MTSDMFEVGETVCVTSYGAFKGLRGTIRRVHSLAYTIDDEKPFLFYQVVLENASVKEPIWFQGEEIDTITL
ncbi:MAG TPA: hypothetical protein VKR06_38735 [Ktedonosporobacter sp.]|nr:hypothetical protein [Ktedonosporobacter sp.]